MLKHYINLTTIIIIAVIFILIAGNFLYIHEKSEMPHKNPIYFALGIVFASGGASILFNLLNKNILPTELYEEISNIKK
jgi:hypothetical protein